MADRPWLRGRRTAGTAQRVSVAFEHRLALLGKRPIGAGEVFGFHA
jgi:hypothetical protein